MTPKEVDFFDSFMDDEDETVSPHKSDLSSSDRTQSSPHSDNQYENSENDELALPDLSELTFENFHQPSQESLFVSPDIHDETNTPESIYENSDDFSESSENVDKDDVSDIEAEMRRRGLIQEDDELNDDEYSFDSDFSHNSEQEEDDSDVSMESVIAEMRSRGLIDEDETLEDDELVAEPEYFDNSDSFAEDDDIALLEEEMRRRGIDLDNDEDEEEDDDEDSESLDWGWSLSEDGEETPESDSETLLDPSRNYTHQDDSAPAWESMGDSDGEDSEDIGWSWETSLSDDESSEDDEAFSPFEDFDPLDDEDDDDDLTEEDLSEEELAELSKVNSVRKNRSEETANEEAEENNSKTKKKNKKTKENKNLFSSFLEKINFEEKKQHILADLRGGDEEDPRKTTDDDDDTERKMPKVLSILLFPFTIIVRGYMWFANLILAILSKIFGILAKIPGVSKVVGSIVFEKLLKIVSIIVPIALILGAAVFFNGRSVETEFSISLPDEGGATMSSYVYDKETGTVSAKISNTGGIIAKVTPSFDMYSSSLLKPWTWFKPSPEFTCTGSQVAVPIDGTINVKVKCPNKPSGLFVKPQGVLNDSGD